ncbi:hypothetical protein SAMN04487936_105240 [Halobacillus dabanensis]|uniref:Copper amine oxidase N-terminal domain-containing protein n=1 Tax=Halobacillus dabanensis TaxID=240302 RepID=A0A1I3VE21_HALDA|nr:hypothetical protein [Halobacillus dabanensis]SFJ92656.1 hypothetical protein SAMN04487936_105240 [Halobacillus dabanensis]
MKRLWIPLSLLVSLSTLLLFYQWSDAKGNAVDNSEPPLRLDIGMAIKEDQVHIGFTYDSLRPGKYSMQLPDEARDLQCTFNGNGTCRIINKAQMNLERIETVTIKYAIPLASTNVLMDWMLELEGNGEKVDPPYTLTLEDYNNIESTWVAPASKSSDIVMDNLRYLEFEQSNGPMPLLQPMEEKVWHYGNSVVTVAEGESLSASTRSELKNFLSLTGPAIVELDRPEVRIENAYLTTKGHDIKALEAEYISSHIKSIADVETSWEAEVMKDVFHQKGTSVAKEILTSLSDEQLSDWKRLLLAEEEVTDISKFLDETLSEVYGLETTFFKEQNRGESLLLYFHHQKKAIIEGTELTEKVLHYQGSTYFPLNELAVSARYDITEIEPGKIYRVKLPDTTYRFFVDETTFIMNEESFGIGNNLLKIMDGIPYIKADYVEELFHLRIISDENLFRLQKKK